MEGYFSKYLHHAKELEMFFMSVENCINVNNEIIIKDVSYIMHIYSYVY